MRLARAVVPARVRSKVGGVLIDCIRRVRSVRWSILSQAQRIECVNRRLLLEESSWLFVVGTSNSGSTMLSRLLALHPSIRDLPDEGQFLTDALACPMKMGHGRTWALKPELFRMIETDDSAAALRCKFDWSRYYAARPGILLEKSPPNILRMRWLQANFAPARFIIITRDPYAVCEGIIRRRPDLSIEDAAQQWVRAHEFMFEDLPSIEQHLLVKYEELVDDPASMLGTFESFLELPAPFDRDLLKHEFPVHNIENKSSTITNFNQRSIARLAADDVKIISRVAGAMMQRLGYKSLN